MSQTIMLDTDALAFDPAVHPERYDSIRIRRSLAFLIDAAVILFLMFLGYRVLAILGMVTPDMAWPLLFAAWPLLAIPYTALTLGVLRSATPGMRFTGIEIRTTRGERMDYGLALLHAFGFWVSVAILTPLVLLVALFTARKQLLHDLVLGTVAVRANP